MEKEMVKKISENPTEENDIIKKDFYTKTFDLSENEYYKIKESYPYILGLVEKTILEKIEFYKKTLNLNQKEFNRLFKIFPTILGYSNQGILKKISFYKSKFNLTQEDFSNILKRFPAIISYSTQNILEKNKFFNNYLNLSQTDFNRIIKLLPSFYSYKNESILEKINFYSTTFELTKEDVIKIIKVFPSILSYNSQNIIDKVQFYMNLFNLSKKEFNDMFKKLPSLLGLSEQSIKNKYECFLDIGLPIECIIKNPRILAAPLKTLKLKYMLFSIVDNDKKFLSINWAVSSFEKSWARYTYLSEHCTKIKPSWIILSESDFQKKYKISSDELMKKHPIDKSVTDFIISKFNSLADTNGSKALEKFLLNLNLTSYEIEDIKNITPAYEYLSLCDVKSIIKVLEIYGFPKSDIPELIYLNPNILVLDKQTLIEKLNTLKANNIDIENYLKNNPFDI